MAHETRRVKKAGGKAFKIALRYLFQIKKEALSINIQIFGKAKCFDTKKAERWFKERGLKYQFIDINQKGLSKGELNAVIAAVGIDALVSEKAEEYHLFKYLSASAKPDKLLETASLYKTPIVRSGKSATVGYCPDVWEKWA